jgi:hypothetical protein
VSCNFNIARGRVRSVVADAVARRVVAGPSEVRLMRRYQVRKRRKAPCVTHLQYFSVVNHKSPQIPPYHNLSTIVSIPRSARRDPLGTRRWSWCAQYRHAHTCASPLHTVRNGTRRAEDKPSLMDNLATTMPPSAPSVAGEGVKHVVLQREGIRGEL